MHISVRVLVLTPVLALAACGRTSSTPMDDGLKSDLSLASQVQSYQPQQIVSPAELGVRSAPSLAAPARRSLAAAPRRRAARRSRPAYSSAGTRSPSAGTYSRPAPRPTHDVKHTERDAAIGAAAGAVLGAVTTHNKVRGAIIGGVAGGILGAVLGNNVDKKRVPFMPSQW